MKAGTSYPDTSSFRDPDGFVFSVGNKLYRQVNQSYRSDYDFLLDSGLYRELTDKSLLIPHSETSRKVIGPGGYKVIEPQLVPFLSYPYEWSFGQIQDAALLTLTIQEIALKYGMTLKDASAYNVQFIGYRPVFIDTLSFTAYHEGEPWVGYRQFCQHFLAPLALMAERDPRLNLLLREYIDGIPLDLASRLLPPRTKFNLSLLSHIHLHAANQKRMAGKKVNQSRYRMTKFQMTSFLGNLKTATNRLKMKKYETEWNDYYSFTNYSDKALKHKKSLFNGFVAKIRPTTFLDLGANTGIFSETVSRSGVYTVACDIDPLSIEKAYQRIKQSRDERLLPLVIDLINPSPAIGWANSERKSIIDRAKVDCVSALALIHHLAISNNLPLRLIASFFAQAGEYLIIEFIPKGDSKVAILLQNRQDIFVDYTKDGFEAAFSEFYDILDAKGIDGSKRTLYLMRRK